MTSRKSCGWDPNETITDQELSDFLEKRFGARPVAERWHTLPSGARVPEFLLANHMIVRPPIKVCYPNAVIDQIDAFDAEMQS